jgi:hypothetical protein
VVVLEAAVDTRSAFGSVLSRLECGTCLNNDPVAETRMRPFELTVAVALTVGPAVGAPLHGGLVHGTQLHVLVDSMLGLVVGVSLVAVYLLVLRRGDSTRDGDGEHSCETPSRGQRSRNS